MTDAEMLASALIFIASAFGLMGSLYFAQGIWAMWKPGRRWIVIKNAALPSITALLCLFMMIIAVKVAS